MNKILLIAFIFCSVSAFSQSYSFHNFNVEDGVSHPFIYDIAQDDRGYLWIATGEGLCKFNGFHFKNYFTADGLTENFVSTLYKGSNGKLWMGHNQGGCTVFQKGEFRQLKTTKHFNSVIRAIREDEQENTWLLSQHSGIIKVNPKEEITAFTTPFSQLLLFDFRITSKGQMLVGTNEGLYLYLLTGEDQEPVLESIVYDIPLTKINCIAPGKLPGQYYVGTEDEGVYVVQLRSNHRVIVTPVGENLHLDQYNIQSILEAPDNSLWIGTFGKGMLHIAPFESNGEYHIISRFNESNGMGSNDIKTVFRDREGNIWAGKFGGNHNAGGISSLSNNAFVFYENPFPDNGGYYSIHNRENIFWMGLKNAVLMVDSGNFKTPTLFTDVHGLPKDIYSSIFVDSDFGVWAGSSTNGIYYKHPSDTIFKTVELSDDRLSLAINDITGNETHIWIATKNGIYEIQRENRAITYYNKEDGLEHNVIKSLSLDKKGNLWYSTASAYLSYIKNGKIVNIVISEDQRVHDQVAITMDNNDNIWLATNGSGLFIFDYESIRTINAHSHGLKSNFCYSIEIDQQDKVWVGHKGGLSCYNPKNDQVNIIDQNQGMFLDFQPNAVLEDNNGKIWWGTNKNLVRYNPSKDIHNSIAPIINIESVIIEDEIQNSTDISLPSGQYKAKFEFLGLSFRKSQEVTYQYILEGHDRDWQDVTANNEANYSRIDPGTYTFKVVAFNSDGIKSPVAAEVRIFIEKPFWQQSWFIVIAALSLVTLMVALLKLRDRRQQRIRRYLKKNLDIRTREVQAKSIELEKKNKDITSSIHYAKKIQDATLPDQWKLQQYFPDSFIYYKPRDIISGDFYWFKIKGDKLIVSVADCTGHGVPGALLSMIGSTKMNDIISNTEIDGPHNIMRKLDEELRQVLQQSSLSTGPQDGMDVVICEIDLNTRLVRMCSAMSNVYIASQDEVTKIDGDRNSIGGFHIGQSKNFTMYEHQMKAGDTLYLTSDGYQDQFGGKKGKKLKRSGFVSLIRKISSRSAKDQHEAIQKHFDEWKGDLDQVDDVLLIGLKF